MIRITRVMRRAWPAVFLGLTLTVGVATVPGCSGGSTNDVAGVNPYSVLPAEEVEKGKAGFLKKMYPEVAAPKKGKGAKAGRTSKAG